MGRNGCNVFTQMHTHTHATVRASSFSSHLRPIPQELGRNSSPFGNVFTGKRPKNTQTDPPMAVKQMVVVVVEKEEEVEK
jgi:hypothetical protein